MTYVSNDRLAADTGIVFNDMRPWIHEGHPARRFEPIDQKSVDLKAVFGLPRPVNRKSKASHVEHGRLTSSTKRRTWMEVVKVYMFAL
jgi:hypothetical protein